MTTKLQIETFESDHALPLYEESQGQTGPAYLYLDTRDGDVYVKGIHPAYANSWGHDENDGHVRRWNIANNLTVCGVNELLLDSHVQMLLETIMSGAEQYYDGSNYRTTLNETATAASDDLERHLSDCVYDSLEPWSAHQWLDCTSYSDCVAEPESHQDAAERLAAEALAKGVYLSLFDIESALSDKKMRTAEYD